MTNARRPTLVAILAALPWAPAALARPYVTLHDDGSFASFNSTTTSPLAASASLMALYDKTGQPRPQTLSCWFGFPLGGESYGTFFLQQSNAVKGIGLSTFKSKYGPVQAILLHNDGLVLGQRAMENRANTDPVAYGTYLFLLEFSHQYLAAIRVPGSSPDDLGSFPHWSFWYSSGGSPPGGNIWQDNGDGTFSTLPIDPAQVKYSMLDLYLMGLAAPSEVGDIDVLENPVPPATPTDPTTGKPFSTASLTDFDGTPLTVTATEKTYTINDVITANGARTPATASASSSLGIVFIVPQDAGPAEVASDQAIFDPVAVALPAAYAAATSGRATLEVVTWEDGGLELTTASDAGPLDGGEDAGPPDAGDTVGESGPDAGTKAAAKGGCSTGGGSFTPLWLLGLLGSALRRGRGPAAP